MKRSKWFSGSENNLTTQGSGMAVMKNGGWRYCSGWGINWIVVSQLNDFSWTYQRHWDGLVVLTPTDGWCGRPMVKWSVNEITQPDSIMVMESKFHVQEWPATVKFFKSSSLFPLSLLTNTSLFLSSLRKTTYACSIIFPLGKPVAMF